MAFLNLTSGLMQDVAAAMKGRRARKTRFLLVKFVFNVMKCFMTISLHWIEPFSLVGSGVGEYLLPKYAQQHGPRCAHQRL